MIGAIYTMLYEVHRLLKIGGAYVIFSLNTEALLGPLLGTPALGYDTKSYQIVKKNCYNNNDNTDCNIDQKLDQNGKVNSKNNNENNNENSAENNAENNCESDKSDLLNEELLDNEVLMGTVVICKKLRLFIVDKIKLQEEEREIMDNYFKVEIPFLTEVQEEWIKNNFEAIFLASNLNSNLDTNLSSKLNSKLNLNADLNADINTNVNADIIANINNGEQEMSIENVFITLEEAYTVMFENEEFLEYSYDLFLEDIESFSLNRIGYMSTAEALSFLQTMQ